jgi:hypothetical protein
VKAAFHIGAFCRARAHSELNSHEAADLPEMELNDGMSSSVAVVLRLSAASSRAG